MEVSLPLGTWDGMRFFIVALPGPYVNYFDIRASFGIRCTHRKKNLTDIRVRDISLGFGNHGLLWSEFGKQPVNYVTN